MIKKIGRSLPYFLALFLAKPALAFCPVCTIAVGAGLGLSRWLKIDDTISGIWIGGLAVSLIGWTINWLTAKNIRFYGRKILVTAVFYILTIWPLYWSGVIGHPYNRFWGFDKLIIGIFFGSLIFLAMGLWHNLLKKKNNGRAHFPLQKVVMPIVGLLVTSFLFYFLTKV